VSLKTLRPLAIAVQANAPVVATGGPGVGKTSGIVALAKALDMPCETVIASLREPSDFAGLPIVTDNGVMLAPPAWAKRLVEAGKGILFLDEISTAAPAVQAALLRVVLDRVVGDLPLPQDVRIVAAMNPADQAAGGWELSPPLANRFCHLTWNLNTSEWIDGMLQGFPALTFPIVRDGWETMIPQSRTLVASFIQHKQTSLYNCPKNDSEAGKPWPSPRSWDMASRLSAACKASGAGQDVELPLIAGCVGDGHALEYVNWRDSLDLPDPEALLADPDSFVVPDRGDKAYTILASVAGAAASNLTKGRYLAAWQIFYKAASSGKKDLAAASVKALAVAGSKTGFMADADVRAKVLKYLTPFTEILKAAQLMGN
jgi:hypothetical protein